MQTDTNALPTPHQKCLRFSDPASMNRSGPNDLQKMLDDTRMALHIERMEKSALERQVAEQAAVIAYQKREIGQSRGKCADYDRMKYELENAKNDLVSSLHDIIQSRDNQSTTLKA